MVYKFWYSAAGLYRLLKFLNFTSAAYFHFGYMIDAPRFRLRHIVSASGRIMATVFSPSDENKQKAKNIGRLVDDKEEILLQKDSDDSSETVGSVISNSQLVKISQRRDESQACGEHDSWNMEHEKVASIPTKEWEDVLKRFQRISLEKCVKFQ